MKPEAHASHLSLMILALQLHLPLASQELPIEPCELQLQAKIYKKQSIKYQPKDVYESCIKAI